MIRDAIYKALNSELERSYRRFPLKINSFHEGYAILLEEVDELWAEIKKQEKDRDLRELKNELIQVAAVSLRMLNDLSEEVK